MDEADLDTLDDASAEARKARRNARIFKLMQVLAQAPEGMLLDEAWDASKDAAPMVDDDHERMSN